MADVDLNPATATQQVAADPVQQARKQLSLFHCLVVSVSPSRQEMLARAAAESGWETIVCGDAATALAYVERMFLHLAMVDIQGQEKGDFRTLLEKLAPTTGLLLIVCGNDGDLEEEIWIRQLGAWLYLPGVEDGNDVTLLCVEARHIVERLNELKQNGDRNGCEHRPHLLDRERR